MVRNIEIFSAVFVLGIGVLLGFFYSNYFGGFYSIFPKINKLGAATIPTVKSGALQLYSKDGFFEVRLKAKKEVTHDTYLFQFELPKPDLSLGLETGQHIII
jgi:hypothetical protein